jgi:hypothetical protein
LKPLHQFTSAGWLVGFHSYKADASNILINALILDKSENIKEQLEITKFWLGQ